MVKDEEQLRGTIRGLSRVISRSRNKIAPWVRGELIGLLRLFEESVDGDGNHPLYDAVEPSDPPVE